jgi:hypothetical protein
MMEQAGTSAAVFISLWGTAGHALKQVPFPNPKNRALFFKPTSSYPHLPTSPPPHLQPLLVPRMHSTLPKFSAGSDDVFLVHW